MPKEELSASETEENGSDSSSEELDEAPRNVGNQKMSEYEKQRMKRIEENKARMEALGLHKMANSLMVSVQKPRKKSEPKGKRKLVEEDEDYRPPEGVEMLNSSSDGDDLDDNDDADYSSRSRKKKAKKRSATPKKRMPIQKKLSNSDFIDDDDALMQAIALSLQDSAGFLDIAKSVPSHNSGVLKEGENSEIKQSNNIQEDTGKRKRKKSMTSRVQMTEDELLVHFFQFDEADKGSITLRDLQRIAAARDFTWTDKEMADMIACFDSDRDGKLSLDDFRKIVIRCNMLRLSENAP